MGSEYRSIRKRLLITNALLFVVLYVLVFLNIGRSSEMGSGLDT